MRVESESESEGVGVIVNVEGVGVMNKVRMAWTSRLFSSGSVVVLVVEVGSGCALASISCRASSCLVEDECSARGSV